MRRDDPGVDRIVVTDCFTAVGRLIADGGSGAVITPVAEPSRRFLVDPSGTVLAGEPGQWQPDEHGRSELGRRIRDEVSGIVDFGGGEVFVEVLVPSPTLRIFGAGPIAETLCALAARAGFRVVVADPRPAHAVSERFPDAARVDCGWPQDLLAADRLDERSFVVSLLHTERFEDPLLVGALGSSARYVGALGSRRTHAARRQRLEEQGVDADALDRLHAPIGLSIGAITADEIAVAILAEMVAARRGGVYRGPSATT